MSWISMENWGCAVPYNKAQTLQAGVLSETMDYGSNALAIWTNLEVGIISLTLENEELWIEPNWT